MASEIKVDTISEKTSANGITIDGVNIKDSALATAGSVPLSTIDIDGGTDIGAAVVDADLFIIDDGAGGTNRKVTASRIKTYAGASGDITSIDSILNTDVKIGEDDQTKIDFETANEIHFYADNAEQVYVADGIFGPQSDNDVDLGASGVEWKDAYFDGTVTADAGLFDTLGVITAKDLGAGIHIRTSDSSASVDGTADELVNESSGDAGLSILTGTSNSGHIMFGDSGDNNIGKIQYNHDNDGMFFFNNTAQNMCILSTGKVGIVDAGPDSFLCVSQAADDGDIFTLKSSDVAHGITGMIQTDTFFSLEKYSATEGGLLGRAYTEADIGCQFQVVHTTVNTTASTSGRAGFEISTAKKTGTGKTTTDGQLFAIRNNNSTKLILQEGGQLYVDSSYDNTFDTFEDAQLARAYDLSHGRGVIDSKFDKFISYNHDKLAELDLVGREEDGTPNHFVNVTGMQRLHNGAIWQQYEKHNQLLEAVYDLAKEAVGEEKANAILDKHEVKRLQ